MPGPPKTPTKVLELRGSERAKRRKAEPKPPAGVPVPPTWLKGEALAYWEEMVPRLPPGLATPLDSGSLAQLCRAWADVREAQRQVDAEGRVVTNARGNVNRHPADVSLDSAFTRWLKLADKFGLTPSARANLAIERSDPDENRGKARFFKGG